MKDWEARLIDLDSRLTEWRGRYDAEFRRLRKERGKGLFKRVSEAQIAEIASLAQKAAGEDVLTEVPAFLDELADFYPTALPGVRAKIRAVAGFHYEVFAFLWQYALEGVERIRAEKSELSLRRALIAVSIDDHRVETGLMLDLLGELWLAAESVGVPPAPVFLDIAEVSSPSTSGGAGRTQSYLAGYEGSMHYREHVAPELGGKRRTG